MNIMRKLRGNSDSPHSESQEDAATNPSAHTNLGLMHLKKLFSEYTHPQQPLTDAEKDDKLYKMLPLFRKVFATSPPSEMNEKFWDILAFCQQVSKLMVTEIRKRASNQSTEAASCAIVKFLEIENSEESSNGWMLLSTINLLAAGDHSLIQVMTAAAIPSTLVKCLYLFFDLPKILESETQGESEFSPPERRMLLQKVFVQVLVRLCSHKVPCEELARKDDLKLLFPAVTSACESHNSIWRKTAAEVLVTLSRHGLTPAVVQYIHGKGCIAECVENMQSIPELTPLEVVEMFVAVFCVLKDSSEVSQLLLDDFRQCQGYVFLSEFLLKHQKQQIPDLLTAEGVEEERMGGGEGRAALRNLVLMVSALCSAGHNELRPTRDPAQLYKMAGFQLPRPNNQGSAVKNVQAFQVLQDVFLKSSSPALCCTILDAISSVYHSDNANYFILENQNTLSQFADKIHTKNKEIQEKFYELVEFIVFQLNFVPCKELISLSLILKANSSRICSILCMRTLQNILRFNAIFKDVYRDVGMLEVLVTCLTRYAVYLKDKEMAEEKSTKSNDDLTQKELTRKDEDLTPRAPERKKRASRGETLLKDPTADEEEMYLGSLVMECITVLLHANASNCKMFRECGGAKCVHSMVVHLSCREQALGVIHELIVSGSGEEDMAALLNGMHAAPLDAYKLKLDILKSVLVCLRESHRTRTIFRKVSGFVYVTSILVSMEGKLGTEERASSEMLCLIHCVFYAISTAMRFEPANAKFFHQEICMTTLCDTIRLLGCFNERSQLIEDEEKSDTELYSIFYNVFTQDMLEFTYPADVPPIYVHACIIFRLLYDVALDSFDKPVFCPSLASKTGLSRQSSAVGEGGQGAAPRVVHAGTAVCCARLLPSSPHPKTPHGRACADLLAHVIRSLVRSERNQQTLCMGGLGVVALHNWRSALTLESHALHPPLQYILERLAAHYVSPDQLRDFLRMGNPLNCISPETGKFCKPGGPVPLTRIQTLVSMTTPKDYRSHGTCTQPPFVEFDMSAEGFGCLYLPHIAPQSVNLNAIGAQDLGTFGGIGTGARTFPPPTGLTYSSWICIDKYSDPRTDPHCVRLLTLVRSLNNRPEHLVCLALMISARDKAFVVSTQETLVPHNVGEWEPEGRGDSAARVHCPPELMAEGVWHHVVLVLSRQLVLDNSQAELYVDGQHVHSSRVQYVSCNPGGGGATLAGASSVYALVGTPPPWRRYSRLTWRQGPCLLIEEAVSAQTVSAIYQLGPHYIGTLQAPQSPHKANEILPPLVPEEKVTFGLNARAMSLLTLAKIRKVYSKSDNKAIAKQLGMSSHENATPIRVLHNSAAHLSGPARSLGGTVVGYLGVRVFCPKPASIMIDTVGGCSVLLGLIAMAQDVECLYAGVKALVCVVRANKSAQAEMDRRKGYQTLAMLLKKKRNLLNSHILHLIFGLVGTVDSQKETSSIPNLEAFQDLICELEVWIGAPGGLIKSLLEHLLELATETSHKTHNLRTMRELHLVAKLLYTINDIKVSGTRTVVLSILAALLGTQPRSSDILYVGQYLASTIPNPNQSERDIEINNDSDESEGDIIVLRNKCFHLLHELMFTGRGALNFNVCEEILRVLGHDWLLVFMLHHVHRTSSLWALRILTAMCAARRQQVDLMSRVQNGNFVNGWLRGVYTQPHRLLQCCNPFTLMQWLGPPLHLAERFYLCIGLTLGSACRASRGAGRGAVSVQGAWAALGEAPPRAPHPSSHYNFTLTADPLMLIFRLVRVMVHEGLDETHAEMPSNCMQVIFSLYHSLTDFPALMMSSDVLRALASILFPLPSSNDESQSMQENSGESGPSSPLEDEERLTPSSHMMTENQGLTSNKVREQVFELLRTLILDSLPLSPTRQPPISALMDQESPSYFCSACFIPQRTILQHVIDMVLDASPPNSTHIQQVEYQTEVLASLMDFLLNSDMFSTESNTANVCYVTARLVDKMWQDLLDKDPHDVFDFIVKLVTQSKKKSCMSLENLYHCLNRTILYLLSRPTDSIADQMAVLETLHKLTNHRMLIFGAGNHSLEFVGCLTYCLLQLGANMKIPLDTHQRTTWHVNPSSDLEAQDAKLKEHQGHKLMMVASRRVWEELYACKKPAIEEALRVTLPPPSADMPRDILAASAQRVWRAYLDAEIKAQFRVPWELHNQIQSKIQKVTGGLTRLASRTKVKKEDTGKSRPEIPKHKALQYMMDHVQLVKTAWSLSRGTSWRYVEAAWREAWAELVRERGLWGRESSWRLARWRLHTAEGPSRMRQILVPNPLFYLHYPPQAKIDKQTKYKTAVSLDSEEYYTTYGQWRAPGSHLSDADLLHPDLALPLLNSAKEHVLETPNLGDGSPTDLVNSGVVSRQRLQSGNEGNEETAETEEDDEPQPNLPDNQTLQRLLEPGDVISHSFRCARIQGLDTTEGLFLFGREHCYVVDGFTILKNREIRDLDSCPDDYEPILPSQAIQRSNERQCSKFLYEDIREVHKRRYLLQPMALEVFFSDGSNYLLSFPRKVRNKVLTRLSSLATQLADSAAGSVAGQKRGVAVEQPSSLLATLIGDTSVTQRWLRGEISNFQYLMHLNTLAGRSYNDLMQYPVFPWILADYDSLELDLNDPATFRDLTKPMGAQTPHRREQFRKRFKEWDEPHGETPPYHYGTHYSSAMIVCSYLVRMEPFTQHFLRLQGGHFDLADRMFHSVKEAWNSASKHNMADVKELIPEFFYLPEFLQNMNNFDLGAKQSGERLGEVILPPWAKGDPHEFIRQHRAALESDFVSARLHHWIDLIFGYKQRGPPAQAADNVFHHLFYEGNVDIYNIDDPLKKTATIGFINNFGQIPKQLFKKAHPSKKMSQRSNTILDPNSIISSQSAYTPPDKLFFHNIENLRPSLQPIKEIKGPVGQIIYSEKAILAVEQNKVLMPPSFSKYVAWGFADHSIRIANLDNDKVVLVSESVAQACGEVVACVCPTEKTIITAGTSTVVTVWQVVGRRLSVRWALAAHRGAVSCLAASAAHGLAVSGARDNSAVLWDYARGAYLRSLRLPAPVVAVAIHSVTGDIATCSGPWLHVWSINGVRRARVEVGKDSTAAPLCVAFSLGREWDPLSVVLTGSGDGIVRMWSIEYVEDTGPHEKRDDIDEDHFVNEKKEKNDATSKVHEPETSVDAEDSSETGDVSKEKTTAKRVEHLVRQMSINNDEVVLPKSGSESSLSEAGDVSTSKDVHIHEDNISTHTADNLSSNNGDNISSNAGDNLSFTGDGDNISCENVQNLPSVEDQGDCEAPLLQDISTYKLSKDESTDSTRVEPPHSPRLDSFESRNDVSIDSPRYESAESPRFDSIDSPRYESQLSPRCDSNDSAKLESSRCDSNESFSGLRSSKSDTSLSDSFVVIPAVSRSSEDGKVIRWRTRLVCRGRLTMHTAFERRDNVAPAAVTAIAAARTGRALAIGDRSGRIFRWCVPEGNRGGGPADHWVRDESATHCFRCQVKFSALERRHHCRACGRVVCGSCSRHAAPVRRLRALAPVRVCKTCHQDIANS